MRFDVVCTRGRAARLQIRSDGVVRHLDDPRIAVSPLTLDGARAFERGEIDQRVRPGGGHVARRLCAGFRSKEESRTRRERGADSRKSEAHDRPSAAVTLTT